MGFRLPSFFLRKTTESVFFFKTTIVKNVLMALPFQDQVYIWLLPPLPPFKSGHTTWVSYRSGSTPEGHALCLPQAQWRQPLPDDRFCPLLAGPTFSFPSDIPSPNETCSSVQDCVTTDEKGGDSCIYRQPLPACICHYLSWYEDIKFLISSSVYLSFQMLLPYLHLAFGEVFSYCQV